MKKHGMSHTRIWRIWWDMVLRCTNPSMKNWKAYGGRGIKVCERWLDFENFYADMGERPAGLSLDRVNNNGDYEPANCRWATQLEQSRNTRQNVLLTHNGTTQCIAAWARQLGMSQRTLCNRLQNKWDVKRALTTPALSGRAAQLAAWETRRANR